MIYSEQKTRSSVWNNFVLEKDKNVKVNRFVKSLLSHQKESLVSSYLRSKIIECSIRIGSFTFSQAAFAFSLPIPFK